MTLPINSEAGNLEAMVVAGNRVVTVFGGTGFLGRRIVRHVRRRGIYVRVASRHIGRDDASINPDDPQVQLIKADVHDERSVADALADAYSAVNAVSLYIESAANRVIRLIQFQESVRLVGHALR